MRLVDPDHRLHGAGLCFLCETAIVHPGKPVVNTNIEFDPLMQSPLAGEKYVCNSCADTIAKTLGYAPPDVVESALATAAFDALRFRQLQELAGKLSGELPALIPEAVTATKEKHGSKA